jgi:hypothetical protein
VRYVREFLSLHLARVGFYRISHECLFLLRFNQLRDLHSRRGCSEVAWPTHLHMDHSHLVVVFDSVAFLSHSKLKMFQAIPYLPQYNSSYPSIVRIRRGAQFEIYGSHRRLVAGRHL